MSDVNVQLVRECFELNRFRVATNWRPDGGAGHDTSAQLYIEQSESSVDGDPPGVWLRPHELSAIPRALVDVRAWHADRFYPSVIEGNPVLGQFASSESRQAACAAFGVDSLRTILVISELPHSAGPRNRTLELIAQLGIDHVMEFPALLSDLVSRVSVNAGYPGSHTLQTIRLLKRYRLVRNQQLEFLFSRYAPVDPAAPFAGAADPPEG